MDIITDESRQAMRSWLDKIYNQTPVTVEAFAKIFENLPKEVLAILSQAEDWDDEMEELAPEVQVAYILGWLQSSYIDLALDKAFKHLQ